MYFHSNKRSSQKELLDEDSIPFEDIKQNMRELNTVNTWLGGHNITIKGIEKLIQYNQTGKEISICEIGCGGGDNLDAIYKWCKRKNIAVNFIGIDIKKECISYAKQQYPLLPVKWVVSDYAKVNFGENKPDIIFNSLFCHHFNEPLLESMLQWMKANSRTGFFINDLHRNRTAYLLIKWITRFFSKSYLVKNDAPLSVARGFTIKEWQHIFRKSGIKHYTIEWKWAFRHLIIQRN